MRDISHFYACSEGVVPKQNRTEWKLGSRLVKHCIERKLYCIGEQFLYTKGQQRQQQVCQMTLLKTVQNI